MMEYLPIIFFASIMLALILNFRYIRAKRRAVKLGLVKFPSAVPHVILYIVAFACFVVPLANEYRASQNRKTEAQEEVDSKQSLKNAFDSMITTGVGTFYESVHNDATGKGRVYVYHSSTVASDHAVEYYNAYFDSDDEIHFVVNLGLKTTTKIVSVENKLVVSVYEYVDGEEHDAKVLPGGMLYASYLIDKESGTSEQVE